MRSRLMFAGVLAAAAAACGDDAGTADAIPMWDAAGDGPPPDADLDTLHETGLCADAPCAQIAATALPYTPRWQLWSDTATKRRWITLPPATQIDTTDMDYWLFPVGTKIWKEFSRGVVRVETRLIEKTGPLSDDWVMTPYIWNATQDLALATPPGMDDANGTMHDVPSRAQCRQCHDRQTGDVLGFAALQLDFDGAPGELDLADLVAMNLLSAPPPTDATPVFPLPTDASPGELEAFGYMQANCGHCHNPTSDVFRDITTIDLRMRVGLLATAAMIPSHESTIGVAGAPPVNGATIRVAAMDLAGSILYQRFITTNPSQRMPRLGTEMADPAGQLLIETWINGITP